RQVEKAIELLLCLGLPDQRRLQRGVDDREGGGALTKRKPVGEDHRDQRRNEQAADQNEGWPGDDDARIEGGQRRELQGPVVLRETETCSMDVSRRRTLRACHGGCRLDVGIGRDCPGSGGETIENQQALIALAFEDL